MSKNNKQVKNKTPFHKICFDFNSSEAKPPSLELLQQKLNVEGLPKIPSTLPPLIWLQQPRIKTSKNKITPLVPTYADKCKITPSVPTYADNCKINNIKKTTMKKPLKKEENPNPNININKQKPTEKKAPNKLSWADMMEYDSDDEENESNNFWLIE